MTHCIVPGLWKTGTTLASHLCLSQFGSHCSSLCLSSSHLHPITFPPGLHTSLVTTVLSPVSIHVCLYRSITVYLNAGLSISWYLHSSEHVDVSPAAVKSSERLRAPETIFGFVTSKFSEMWQNCVLVRRPDSSCVRKWSQRVGIGNGTGWTEHSGQHVDQTWTCVP